jgi:hypothetical protein
MLLLSNLSILKPGILSKIKEIEELRGGLQVVRRASNSRD